MARRRGDTTARFRILRGLALACALTPFGAHAQSTDCETLRAALSAPMQQDPASAQYAAAASKLRDELDRAVAYAHNIGCDNQQFLFFGSPPPPQCGGLKGRIAQMQGQYNALASRAAGPEERRRLLLARYNAACRPEGGFLDNLFGGGAQTDPTAPPIEDPNASRGGSQAVCVRTCDGGFFPLNYSAHSARTEQLLQLCQALCPNAEVLLFTKNPSAEISTAVAPDGSAYEDLPNAMKFSKAVDPACGCKPPGKSWVEALAHAEDVLAGMGGAKSNDQTVSEEQAKKMSQPLPPKPPKGADRKRGATMETPVASAPAPAAPAASKLAVDKPADGSAGPVRVVGPKFDNSPSR